MKNVDGEGAVCADRLPSRLTCARAHRQQQRARGIAPRVWLCLAFRLAYAARLRAAGYLAAHRCTFHRRAHSSDTALPATRYLRRAINISRVTRRARRGLTSHAYRMARCASGSFAQSSGGRRVRAYGARAQQRRCRTRVNRRALIVVLTFHNCAATRGAGHRARCTAHDQVSDIWIIRLSPHSMRWRAAWRARCAHGTRTRHNARAARVIVSAVRRVSHSLLTHRLLRAGAQVLRVCARCCISSGAYGQPAA